MEVTKERILYTYSTLQKEVVQLQSSDFWLDIEIDTVEDSYAIILKNSGHRILDFNSFQTSDYFYVFAKQHIPSFSIRRTKEYKKRQGLMII